MGVAEPPQLAARPHHGRFPIPYVTHLRPDGRPDFRVHDNARREECATGCLCQLCGTDLGDEFAFVGFGPSIERRTFGEPPMHLDCLDWAWEVCPFLAGGAWGTEWQLAARDVTILPRPPGGDRYMGVYVTTGYRAVADEEGSGSVKWIAHRRTRPVEWRDRWAGSSQTR